MYSSGWVKRTIDPVLPPPPPPGSTADSLSTGPQMKVESLADSSSGSASASGIKSASEAGAIWFAFDLWFCQVDAVNHLLSHHKKIYSFCLLPFFIAWQQSVCAGSFFHTYTTKVANVFTHVNQRRMRFPTGCEPWDDTLLQNCP